MFYTLGNVLQVHGNLLLLSKTIAFLCPPTTSICCWRYIITRNPNEERWQNDRVFEVFEISNKGIFCFPDHQDL